MKQKTKEQLEQILDKELDRRIFVFSEFNLAFEEVGFDYRGDQCFELDNHKNCVLWLGLNNEAYDFVVEYIASRQLLPIPAPEEAYYNNLIRPNMPIAESNDLKYNVTYNEPHWLPVTLISRDQLDDVATQAMLNIL